MENLFRSELGQQAENETARRPFRALRSGKFQVCRRRPTESRPNAAYGPLQPAEFLSSVREEPVMVCGR